MSGIAGLGAIKDIGDIATGLRDLHSGNIAGGVNDILKGVEGLEHDNKHCQDKGHNDFQQLLSALEQGQNNNQIQQLLSELGQGQNNNQIQQLISELGL
jgi:hypothetical protein